VLRMKAPGRRPLAVAALAVIGVVLALVLAWQVPQAPFPKGGDAEPASGSSASLGKGPGADSAEGSDKGPWGSVAAEGAGNAQVDGAEVTSYRSGLDLRGQSSELLRGYRDAGSCLLREAGYLDLVGNAWGCVVQGPTWVDVCVVTAREDGGSDVRIVHMRSDEWEDVYEGQ